MASTNTRYHDELGFSLLELMTVVAVLGVFATLAFPSVRRMTNRMEAKTSAQQLAGMINDARDHALNEGTPHLVYFETPTVGEDGTCSPVAVEVRDADHSYSITPGDTSTELHLPASACKKIDVYGAVPDAPIETAAVPLPVDDLAKRAPDAAENAAKAKGPKAPKPAPPAKGPGPAPAPPAAPAAEENARSATVAETVVNGATFPIDAADGRPVLAFSEHGVAVDPASPTEWGSGAGAVYLTDGETTVVGAVVAPLGDVQLRLFDTASGSWK